MPRHAKVTKINYIYNDDDLFLLTVYVPCGSIYENVNSFKAKKVAGMSHFLEHLLFKHTENFSGQEILKAFTQIGGYYNASTDKDQTMFYVKTLSENYQLATSLIYDIVAKPVFHEEELEVEKKVVLEEFAQSKDSLSDMIYEQATTTLLSKDNIYLPPVIGTKSDLKAMTTHNVLEYYKAYYKDLIVVINCTREIRNEVHRYMTKLFGKNFAVSFDDKTLFSSSLQFVQRENILIVPSQTYQYNTSLLLPAFRFAEQTKNLHLNFVKFCLSDAGLYSLMTYQIREKRGLVYSIRMSNERMRYLGMFRISFGTSNRDLVGILRVVIQILADMKQFGLSKKNLTYFKTSYKNHLKYKFANEEYRASWVGDNLFYGCPMTETNFIKGINDISNNDIKAICQEVFDFNRMGVYSTGAYTDIRSIKKDIKSLLLEHSTCSKTESNSIGFSTVV